ncbi:peroxidase family protein [Sphingopyxis panaciterrae]
MVAYIRSDLDFILAQIKIAEAHAAGQPLFGEDGLIPTYNLAWGLRTVDGSYNNLLPGREHWGAADQQFVERLGTDFRTIMVDPDGPGPAPLVPVSYAPGVDNDGPGTAGPSDVFDPEVRTISNLIVDQTLGNPAAILAALSRAGVDPANQMTITGQISAEYAPLRPLYDALGAAERTYANASAAAAASPGNAALQAAAAAAQTAVNDALTAVDAVDDALVALLSANGITLNGVNVSLPAIAPDEGLSAPFNSWFTLFGQFFDHGLDLVNKGGSGTVFIPLQPDDPLYVPGSPTNFMVLTRATVLPGDDGILNTADDIRPINHTTSFVDQNQTYTSHASHQVFVRGYELNGDGRPVATGKLIEGGNGGMATWADVKAQALMLGIALQDVDVGSVPLLRTDQYGNFIPNADGYAQVIVGLGPDGIPNTADDIVVSGTPDAPVIPTDVFAIRTGHAFLADIAHSAVPDGLADGDIEIGLDNPGNTPGVYDNELLDAHFIAGDGRANENIGLTAVHHVFHSEHNRLVEHTKQVTLDDAAAMLAGGATQAEAVAFLNEWLEVDVTSVPDTVGEIDNLVWDGERLFQAAKFGTEMQYQHLVFEEFARKVQPNINVFLVPDGYDATIDPSIVAEFAHVVYRFGHSMLTETIDRFDPSFNADHIGLIEGFLNPIQFENNGTNAVVDADIAAGAIIRGMTRQVGNEIDEFVTSALRNNLLGLPLDLATINLARGRDTGVPSLNAARREFYEVTNNAAELKPYESWVDFAEHLKNEASIINFVAAYGTHDLITDQTTLQGKRDAALTIITGVSVGGLDVPADRIDFLNATGAYAGGALGGLENVDLWIGGLAEEIMPFGGMLGSTFNFVFEVQMESLQNGDRFYYLQRLDGLHLFGEMEGNSFAAMIMRNTNATHLPSDVFSTPGLILEVDQTHQYNPGLGETAGADGILLDDPLTVADESADNLGNDPIGGGILTPIVVRNDPSTPGADTNYLKYSGGDHVVLGGTDNADTLIGGIGDDTLFGDGGNDNLQGGFGNDIINAGDGDDIIRDTGGDDNIKAGAGNDVVHAGPGLDLVLAGSGNDFVILGTDAGSEVFAGEGDDFILGNKNAERILGNEGNDWIETGTFDGAPGDNFDEIFAHDGIDGHDIFLGDGGFDEFIGEGGDDIMVGSLGRGKMAGMSGFDWATYKDNVAGVVADLSIPIVFDESPVLPQNAALDEFESMEGLSGTRFNDILRGSNEDATTLLPAAQGGSNGFLGGGLDAQGIALVSGLQAVVGAGVNFFGAGDIILGGDGSDMIQGNGGDDIIDGDKWLNVRISVRTDIDNPDTEIDSADSMTELITEMFNGTYHAGQLVAVREILTADGSNDVDTAVFTDLRANYDITYNADGTVTVAHVGGTLADGIDTLRNIERLQFTDNIFDLGVPVINDLTPTEGQTLTVNTTGVPAPEPFTYQWQSSVNGTIWANIGGATGATFTPNDLPGTTFGAQAGLLLRVVVSGIASGATGPVGVDWDATVASTLNGTAGDDIGDGSNQVDTLNGNGGDDALNGNGGNDTLRGGAGIDTTNGGLGDDMHFVDAAGDIVIEAAGQGTADRVQASVSYALAAAAEVEMLTTDNANAVSAINLTGNGFDNHLQGNAGANTLIGGGGADILNGRVGIDRTEGGLGNDRHYVDNAADVVIETAGQGNDRVLTNVSYALSAAAEIELFTTDNAAATTALNMTGNGTANNIQGNAGANVIDGGGGNDVIAGFAGNDTLRGGAGIDTTNGGLGDDMHFVDAAGDIVIEAAGQGTADRVQTSVTYSLAAAAEVEMLTTDNANAVSAINLTGNGFDNHLQGNAGANTLIGGGGADILNGRVGIDRTEGGLGNDRHYVDNAADIVIETAGQGNDRVLTNVSYALSAAAEIEVFTTDNAAATTALDMTGSGTANNIQGNAGANVIDGGGGNDVIAGFAGNDTIVQTGATGGRDRVDGGDGVDTYQLNGVAGAEAFTILTRTEAVTAGITGLLATTEIVVTRGGVNNASVIAELDNIEEIVVNTLAVTANDGGGINQGTNNGDTVTVVGDFTTTSLDYSTITVNAGGANDVVDISRLSSDHRLVFNGGGGQDRVVGTLRPQDEVDFGVAAPAAVAAAAATAAASDFVLSAQNLKMMMQLPQKMDWAFDDLGSRLRSALTPLDTLIDSVGQLGDFAPRSTPLARAQEGDFDDDQSGGLHRDLFDVSCYLIP